ncbi:hypothetical protein RCL1_004338 [Eukaryota sp. TZLM3-RCL]
MHRPRSKQTPRRRFRPVGQSDIDSDSCPSDDNTSFSSTFNHPFSAFGRISPTLSSSFASLSRTEPVLDLSISNLKTDNFSKNSSFTCENCLILRQKHKVLSSLSSQEVSNLKEENSILKSLIKDSFQMIESLLKSSPTPSITFPNVTGDEQISNIQNHLIELKTIAVESLSHFSSQDSVNLRLKILESENNRLRKIIQSLLINKQST